MKNKLNHGLRPYFILFILAAVLFTGCSWMSPGSVEDPGEAIGAPTEPEVIREGFESGADYPEENF